MKVILTSALLSTLLATAAQAEIKVETRAFHSYLHTDASSAVYITDKDVYEETVGQSFHNTGGIGVAGLVGLNQAIDLGLGYSYARYYFDPSSQMNDQVINGFARFNILSSESGKFYALAGISSHQFDVNNETRKLGLVTYDVKNSVSPLTNLDAGLGGSLKLGSVDLGVEYKYSNSLSKGKVNSKYTSRYSSGGINLVDTDIEKVKGFTAEVQELSLTAGVAL